MKKQLSTRLLASAASLTPIRPRAALAGLSLAVLLLAASGAHAQTIYMSNNSENIDRFTPPGPVSLYADLPVNANPRGLEFDTLGNLFVAGEAGITKITPDGTVTSRLCPPPPAHTAWPSMPATISTWRAPLPAASSRSPRRAR